MDEQQLALILSNIAFVHAANARVAGMIAENMQREVLGHSMAHDAAAFDHEAAIIEGHALALRQQGGC